MKLSSVPESMRVPTESAPPCQERWTLNLAGPVDVGEREIRLTWNPLVSSEPNLLAA